MPCLTAVAYSAVRYLLCDANASIAWQQMAQYSVFIERDVLVRRIGPHSDWNQSSNTNPAIADDQTCELDAALQASILRSE
jgi:hypothetical protein